MSGRKARAARHAAAPGVRSKRPRFWRSWTGTLVGLAVAAVIAASFVLPDVLDGKRTVRSRAGTAMGVEPGAGLPAGSAVPEFSERDVETDQAITSASVFGRRTLLFFSEGVMCQA
jgi:hypothetical protein